MPMRVEVELQAEWDFGLLQRKHSGDLAALAELTAAYYGIVAELRSGHPSIWTMLSEEYPDAFVSFYPPLQGHFRKIAEDKVTIISFTEMERETLP
jgi:hypothetical protein